MRRLRWLAGFMVFGLIAAACGGGDQGAVWITTPTTVVSESVPGWSTYKDPGGWSIQYAPEWHSSGGGLVFSQRASTFELKDSVRFFDGDGGMLTISDFEWYSDPVGSEDFALHYPWFATVLTKTEEGNTYWDLDLGAGRTMAVASSTLHGYKLNSVYLEDGHMWALSLFPGGTDESVRDGISMFKTFQPPEDVPPITPRITETIPGREGWVRYTSEQLDWSIGLPPEWMFCEDLSEDSFEVRLERGDESGSWVRVIAAPPREPVRDTDELVSLSIAENLAAMGDPASIDRLDLSTGDPIQVLIYEDWTPEGWPTMPTVEGLLFAAPWAYHFTSFYVPLEEFEAVLSTFVPPTS